MRPPDPTGTSRDPGALLIIGIHREELAFGERVAEGLGPELIDLLRIPAGISGRRPQPDQVFYYELRHRELYLQIKAQIHGRYSLVVDLHCGLDQAGPCADVISRDTGLLACVERQATERFGATPRSRPVRAVLLEGQASNPSPPGVARGRTVIPPGVWDDPALCYVGLEVYLRRPGTGDERDWALARWLTRAVLACRPAASHAADQQ